MSVAGLGVGQQVGLAQEWEALGCTHVSLNTMGAGLETLAAHLEAVSRFAEAGSGDLRHERVWHDAHLATDAPESGSPEEPYR